MRLGDRLRYERENKDLTQQQLGDLIGVAKQTISVYENGTKFPTIQTLMKIADVFDCSIDYLLGRTDNRGISIVEVAHEGKTAAVGVPKDQAHKIKEIEQEVHRLLNEINKIKK